MNTTAPVRLFVDAHVFDGEFQGSRTFIEGIYNILSQEDDIKLYLAAYDIDNLRKYFPGRNNINFIKYKRRSAWWRLCFDIPSIIKKHKIEYAHFQYIVPLFKNCRYIVTTHDVLFEEYPEEFSSTYKTKRKYFFKRGVAKADILTTVSDHSKRAIKKYVGIDEKKIHVIPPAVNERYFEAYDKQEAKEFIQNKYGFNKFILFVSRFEPRKNHVLLLKAFVELELYKQGYHLVCIGWKSMNVPEFDDLADQLTAAIRSFIFINNKMSEEELLSFYRAADLFVYPSKAEGFGIPPLEAAAAKVPVLCSNSSAMSDFSFFGAGLFDPADYPSFKKKLSEVINSTVDQTYIDKLSATIRQKYSWDVSAGKLYQLIKNDH